MIFPPISHFFVWAKVKVMSEMKNFIAATCEDEETTFAGWLKAMPAAVGILEGAVQSNVLGLLSGMVAHVEPLKKMKVSFDNNGLPDLGQAAFAVCEMEATAFPALWSVTLAKCQKLLLTTQPWFLKVAGANPQFLPKPDSLAPADKDFFQKCATHEIPDSSMNALKSMAVLVKKEDELKVMQGKFLFQLLMARTAAALQACAQMGQAPVAPGQWATEIGQLTKAMEIVAETHRELKLICPPQEEGGNDHITRYMSQYVAEAYLAPLAQVFSATNQAVASIPDNLERMLEGKAVQQLKSTVFHRKTHVATCEHLDPIVAATEQTANFVKACAYMLTPPILQKLKGQETNAKQLRVYAATVHTLNMLLHKMNGRSSREKAAMIRECLRFHKGMWVSSCSLVANLSHSLWSL